MFRAVRRARRVVSLVRAPARASRAADLWLVDLRWIAAGGMLVTTLVAHALVPGLALAPLLALVGAVALANVAWRARLARARTGESWVGWQLAGDLLLLAGVLWFSGGVDNPFAAFLTFQIVLAGLLGGGDAAVRTAALALVLLALLVFAPPLPLASARWPAELVVRLAHLVALVGLGAFIGLSVYAVGNRVAQMQRESESRERLAMLGRIAGGMAHELNTPLATILLASRELVAAARAHDEAVVTQLSEALVSEAERASELIELLRGEVRAGRLERVDVGRLAREVTHAELDRLGFRGERAVDASDGLDAWASAAGVARILANVLTNAVQATAQLATPHVSVRVSADGDVVRVVVADDGPGIRAEVLRHLGEPFRTTRELEGGTGLGLYVCSVLAARMGAQLAIECPEGGSTRVTLAVQRRAPGAPDAG